MTARRTYMPLLLPLLLMCVLAAWHWAAWMEFGGQAPSAPGVWLPAAGIAGAAMALLIPFQVPREQGARGLAMRLRRGGFGAGCVLIGLTHVLALRDSEPVFVMMAYMMLVLACYETGDIALGLMLRYQGNIPGQAWDTYLRMLTGLSGRLAAAFLLSVLLLYIGLLSVAGFTGPLSAALLALLCLLAVGLIMLARR